jgi:hypothetical protein
MNLLHHAMGFVQPVVLPAVSELELEVRVELLTAGEDETERRVTELGSDTGSDLLRI